VAIRVLGELTNPSCTKKEKTVSNESNVMKVEILSGVVSNDGDVVKMEKLSGVVVSNDGDVALVEVSNGATAECLREHATETREVFLAYLPIGAKLPVSLVGTPVCKDRIKVKLQPTAYKLRDEFVQREEARMANVNKLCEEIAQMEAKKAAKKAARQAKKAQAV
jgi:hypothetical protein